MQGDEEGQGRASREASASPAPPKALSRAASEASSGAARPSEDDCSVRVAVRLRPLIAEERYQHCEECIRHVGDSQQVVVGKHSFTFDHVLAPAVPQEAIYDVLARPLLDQFLAGYHATILAYGQTGSGKTYTMGSQSSLNLAPEERGIIPRFIADLVERVQADAAEGAAQAMLRVQFLEVYGEDVNDLLNPLGSRVAIREVDGQVVAQGASEVPFISAEEAIELLEKGTLHRSTGATNMNARSSRSHAIFTLLLERTDDLAPGSDTPESGPAVTVVSKFHFVDLAGSERAKRTGATGKRLREGIDINRGLLTLGNVISALGDDKKRGRVHVPYRDSKLTRMLQDSLGGNSKTVMICCVSPSDSNLSESLNALRYANRARNIQNRPVVNRDAKQALILGMRDMLARLAAELLGWRRGDGSEEALERGDGVALDELEELAQQRWSAPRAPSAPNGGRKRSAPAAADARMAPAPGLPLASAALMAEKARLERRAEALSRDTEELSRRLSFVCAEKDFFREKWAAAQPEEARALLELEHGEGADGAPEKTQAIAALQQLHARVEQLEGELRVERSNRARSGASGGGPAGSLREESMDGADSGHLDPEVVAFEKAQQQMSMAIDELATSIDVKEEMLVHLESQRTKFAYLRTFYETRLSAANAEIETILGDRQKLLEELQQLQAAGPEATGAVEKEKEALMQRLRQKEEELKNLRKTQRQLQDHSQIRQRSERQIGELERELAAQRQRRAEMIRRMNVEKKKMGQLLAARGKEISTLQRQVSRAQQASQRLKQRGDKKERQEKRHVEEITTLRRKVAALRRLQTQDRSYVMRPEDRQMRRYLQAKLREVAEKEDRIAKLEKEYDERLRMLEKRERLEDQRAALALRRRSLSPPPPLPHQADPKYDMLDPRPDAHALDLDLLAVEEQLEDCNAALEYKRQKILDLEQQVERPDAPTPTPTEASVASILETSSISADVICDRILESCETPEDFGSYIRVLFGMLKTGNIQLRVTREEAQTMGGKLDKMESQMELYRRGAAAEKEGYERRLLDLRREQDAKVGEMLEMSGLLNVFERGEGVEAQMPAGDAQVAAILELLRHRQGQHGQRTAEAEAALGDLQGRFATQAAALRDAEERHASQTEALRWKELELRSVQARYRELRDRWRISTSGGGGLLRRLAQGGADDGCVEPSAVDDDDDLADGVYESTQESREVRVEPPAPSRPASQKLKGRGKARGQAPRQKAGPAEGRRNNIFDAMDRAAEAIGAASLPSPPTQPPGPGMLLPPGPDAPVFDRLTDPKFYTGIHKPKTRVAHAMLEEDDIVGSLIPELEGHGIGTGTGDAAPAWNRDTHPDALPEAQLAVTGTSVSSRGTSSAPQKSRGPAAGTGSVPSSFSSPAPRSGMVRPRTPPSGPKGAVAKARAETTPGTPTARASSPTSAPGSLDAMPTRWLEDYRRENVFSRLTSRQNFTGIHRSRASQAARSPSPPMGEGGT